MEEEYLIEEVFLETDAPDTAEIEIEEDNFANFIIQSENTNIETEMLVSGIGGTEPSVQEYMAIIDLTTSSSNVANIQYREEEIIKTEQLLEELIRLEANDGK